MPKLGLTGLARLPLALLDYANEHGYDRRELEVAAGFTEQELADPDQRIEIGKMWDLWRVVIEKVADPAFGVKVGGAMKVKKFGLVGYAMFYSTNLREGLRRLARYSHIISKALQYVLTESGELIVEPAPRLDALRVPVDARLSAVLAGAREVTGKDVSPIEVHFNYPGTVGTPEHRSFFRAPLRFGQPKAKLVFRPQDLALPIVAADETLSGYLENMAEEVLQTLDDRGSFELKVRRAVWLELSGGPPSLQRTADLLGVSARTLQRRLREEKTTFAAVLDSFRREMALRLLKDRNLAIYEIAFLLGYSEPSTFYRAFRRWCAVSPDEYRRSEASVQASNT